MWTRQSLHMEMPECVGINSLPNRRQLSWEDSAVVMLLWLKIVVRWRMLHRSNAGHDEGQGFASVTPWVGMQLESTCVRCEEAGVLSCCWLLLCGAGCGGCFLDAYSNASRIRCRRCALDQPAGDACISASCWMGKPSWVGHWCDYTNCPEVRLPAQRVRCPLSFWSVLRLRTRIRIIEQADASGFARNRRGHDHTNFA